MRAHVRAFRVEGLLGMHAGLIRVGLPGTVFGTLLLYLLLLSSTVYFSEDSGRGLPRALSDETESLLMHIQLYPQGVL